MAPNRIVDMASAFYESCVLFAASDLGVFKKLADLGESDLATALAACGRLKEMALTGPAGREAGNAPGRRQGAYPGLRGPRQFPRP
jgi:hypothetical protein